MRYGRCGAPVSIARRARLLSRRCFSCGRARRAVERDAAMKMDSATTDIAQFLEMQAAERGAAANTIEAYRRDLWHFVLHLECRGRALRQALPADIAGY